MTVEQIRATLGVENGEEGDKFPVGMRVLAVDDDPTCLMLLDHLLRKCHYKVTTTNQARTALQMLREDRERFDLVISDVHMPDMDGFKLLELVGLEMDLPVIMLSANGDAKLVMKGVHHGACDYLVKPVRLEELRNIWQHVIRRKKSETKHQNKHVARDEVQQGSTEDVLTSSADQNGKMNRKRKDEEEGEEEGESEENEYENEDPGNQKRPRVVWSIDLHRKFVAAVNQLGIDKAVPKMILDRMNVDGLTRENVASHLQKYRLYLRRISSVATQQANMVAAFGGRDTSYMRNGSIDGFGDFRTFAASGRIPYTTLSPYQQSALLGRLNTPAGVSHSSLASSPLIQPSYGQNSAHSISSLGKYQNSSSFQGIIDNLQQRKCTNQFESLNMFTDMRATIGSSDNALPSFPSNLQQTLGAEGFESRSSFNGASFNSEPLNVGGSRGSCFLEIGSSNGNWQNSIQLPKFPSDSSPVREKINHNQLPCNKLRENGSSTSHVIQNTPVGFTSISTVTSPHDIVRNVNQTSSQHSREHKWNHAESSNTLNAMVPACGLTAPLNSGLDQLKGVCSRNMDASLIVQSNYDTSTTVQHGAVEKLTLTSKLNSNEEYLSEQTRTRRGSDPNNCDSLDDLMSVMIKRDQEGMAITDGEYGFGTYPFGSYI